MSNLSVLKFKEDIFNELSSTEQESIIGEAYAKEHKIIIE